LVIEFCKPAFIITDNAISHFLFIFNHLVNALF
jgi:hypothetical protein